MDTNIMIYSIKGFGEVNNNIIITIIMYFSQQQEEQTNKKPTQYKKNTATQKHNNSLNEITKLKLREMKKRLNIHKEKK